MVMERNFQPVIIFSFSKKECEAYALQMSKLDFNSGQKPISKISISFLLVTSPVNIKSEYN